jgi:glycosyltransferase involved in cell wall biosynthesis
MKVLIAAASFASSISGVQRHALNLVRCLLSRREITEIHLAVAPWQWGMVEAAGLPHDYRLQTHIADIDRGSLSRNLWHYRKLPQLAKQLGVDLVHFSYPMPLNARAFPCPTVVTLHDLYPYEIPRNFGFPKFLFNRAVLRQCLRAADAIACVSESTRMQLKQYAPDSVWKKAVRIYNCVEPATASAFESPIPSWNGEPFLLCIAQHRRNKNIPTLLRAFDHLLRSEWIEPGSKLIVIGIRGPETPHIRQLVRRFNLSRSVYLLEGLSEANLQWCYRNCEALVAPSLTEGFGLPVAEGRLSGCRIVCSDIPAHREIGDASCRFVALRDHASQTLAAAIADSLDEPKSEPIALPQFSASVVAAEYLNLYRNLIGSAAPVRTMTTASANGLPTSEAASIEVSDGQSALAYRGE